MENYRYNLRPMRNVLGKPFKTVVRDREDQPIYEAVLNDRGDPVYQATEGKNGKTDMIPASKMVMRDMTEDALPMLLRQLFLNMDGRDIPMTKDDGIQGHRLMMACIEAEEGGFKTLVLGRGVYD